MDEDRSHFDRESPMSEQDRRIAEYVAQAVVARLLSAVQSDELLDSTVEKWGGKLDRIIGRALRRLGFYVLLGLIALGSLKLGLVDKFFSAFKP